MIKRTYSIAGMTCNGCENTVKKNLISVDGVLDVEMPENSGRAVITMSSPLDLPALQAVLSEKYKISEGFDPASQIKALKPKVTWSDRKVWLRAAFNTLNCLIGCSIGDFGMIIFLQHYYPSTPMWIQMILAVIAGLITSIMLETFILHFREKMVLKVALFTAFGMSFISMVAMEISMNLTDFMVTGGKLALSDPNYWFAFIPSAIVGFLVPMPYNYYKLKKYNKACH